MRRFRQPAALAGGGRRGRRRHRVLVWALAMNGRGRALLRLLAVQGSWNYERMQGIGMGYAAEPLLADLRRRIRSATPRRWCGPPSSSTANPYLAGLALGAATRAEDEAVPGEQVARLRTALAGPLGALGDGLFWAGILPARSGSRWPPLALGAGGGRWSRFLVVFNALRLVAGWWSLGPGSMRACGSAVRSARRASRARRPGPAPRRPSPSELAAPIVSAWLLHPFGLPRRRAAPG